VAARRTISRILIAVLLAVVVCILLVVLFTWGVGTGGSGPG
jgi:hypothetical protein